MHHDVKFLGAGILGVVKGLLFEMSLIDFPRRAELDEVQADQYYPLSLYLDLVSFLEEKFGPSMMLKLGKAVGESVVDAAFPDTVRTVPDAIAAIDVAHGQFCVPRVGAFEIVAQEKGRMTIRYDAPYHCLLQEGLFQAIVARYGGRAVSVKHISCRKGDLQDHCVYQLDFIQEGAEPS